MDFSDHQNAARAWGGSMASIHSSEEYNYILKKTNSAIVGFLEVKEKREVMHTMEVLMLGSGLMEVLGTLQNGVHKMEENQIII